MRLDCVLSSTSSMLACIAWRQTGYPRQWIGQSGNLKSYGISYGRKDYLREATPEFTITVGPVWPVINSMIREQGAELLVLGTHARSGLPKFVLGSVAESAFREAKCAVMTVGPHARKGRGSGDPPEHLLVPTDLSFESSNALRYGVSLATAIGSHVTLLNVLSRNGHSHPEQEMRKHLAESINEHARSTTMVSRRAEYGSPASTILAVAGQLDSELIVMGLEAWSDRPTPMWRTAYEIVLRARCPVLSMRTPARTASDA